MRRPSEQLRRILEELGATRVEENQKSIAHLKLAHNNLSKLWSAALVAEQNDVSPSKMNAQELVRLVIWKRHARLCSLLNEFFRDGPPGTFVRMYATSVGTHRFTVTREEHPDATTHMVYTFALTSAGACNDHSLQQTDSNPSNSST